jgi:hypothetical protein
MDEARAVLERLGRIDVLERAGAHPAHLLAELRELVREAELWLAAERDDTRRAADALDDCREALERRAVEVSRSLSSV